MDKKSNESKTSYAGLGLVFGTAIGAVITVVIDQPIYWAGIGTVIGLIIGAAIDSTKKK